LIDRFGGIFVMISSIFRGAIKVKSYQFCHFRAMSSGRYLVEDENFSFLKELGLERVNKGVYNGSQWKGSGETISSIDPGKCAHVFKFGFIF
jgi:hypothetical protein